MTTIKNTKITTPKKLTKPCITIQGPNFLEQSTKENNRDKSNMREKKQGVLK